MWNKKYMTTIKNDTVSPSNDYYDLKNHPKLAKKYAINGNWRFALERRALFGELDALGHLNHTTFLRYFEDARLSYLMFHGLDAPKSHSLGSVCVLAKLEATYKQPVLFGEQLLVTVRASRIGNTSLDLEYCAWCLEKGECCTSKSLLVLVISSTGEKVSVSKSMRLSINTFENIQL